VSEIKTISQACEALVEARELPARMAADQRRSDLRRLCTAISIIAIGLALILFVTVL
jgi:predicted cobalt transporter CbtA